jgi:prepilin-type N-terminal cleavage/methylation domain-containing protein
MPNKNIRGFTLIELLVVIMIIGILSGVMVSVLNPQRQRDRAKFAVVKSNMEKVCLAANACAAASLDAVNECDDYTKIGVIEPPGEVVGNWKEGYTSSFATPLDALEYFGYGYSDDDGNNAKDPAELGCLFSCEYHSGEEGFTFLTNQGMDSNNAIYPHPDWTSNCPLE